MVLVRSIFFLFGPKKRIVKKCCRDILRNAHFLTWKKFQISCHQIVQWSFILINVEIPSHFDIYELDLCFLSLSLLVVLLCFMFRPSQVTEMSWNNKGPGKQVYNFKMLSPRHFLVKKNYCSSRKPDLTLELTTSWINYNAKINLNRT